MVKAGGDDINVRHSLKEGGRETMRIKRRMLGKNNSFQFLFDRK